MNNQSTLSEETTALLGEILLTPSEVTLQDRFTFASDTSAHCNGHCDGRCHA